jgi:GcrA cell cycle regulator
MSIHWRQLDTTGRIQAIRSVWVAGCTSKEIAAHFDGATRNAVIGMYHRYPNSLIDKPLAPGHVVYDPGTQKIRRRRSSTAFPTANKLSKPLVAPPIVASEQHVCGKTMMMLKRQQCKWPVNDPDKADLHLFCGIATRTIYCEVHAVRSVRRDQ